jgi:hypothetical protein
VVAKRKLHSLCTYVRRVSSFAFVADDDFEVLFSFTKRLSDFYGAYSNVATTSSNFTSVSKISISFLVRNDAVDPTFLISS